MPTLATIRRPKPPPALLTECRFELVVAPTFAGRATNRLSLNSTRMLAPKSVKLVVRITAGPLRPTFSETTRPSVVSWITASSSDGSVRRATVPVVWPWPRMLVPRITSVTGSWRSIGLATASRSSLVDTVMNALECENFSRTAATSSALAKPANKSSRRPMAVEVDSVGRGVGIELLGQRVELFAVGLGLILLAGHRRDVDVVPQRGGDRPELFQVESGLILIQSIVVATSGSNATLPSAWSAVWKSSHLRYESHCLPLAERGRTKRSSASACFCRFA